MYHSIVADFSSRRVKIRPKAWVRFFVPSIECRVGLSGFCPDSIPEMAQPRLQLCSHRFRDFRVILD
jgi:hypothetical protein